MDYELWSLIENDPYIAVKVENVISIPKLPNELTEHDKRNLSLNARAVNILYCALNRDEFNRVQM